MIKINSLLKVRRLCAARGNAPSPIEEQWLGGQKTYVLHHKTPINSGGAVYDMDNLIILTPRFHKEVLAPSYHYGYGY